MKKALIGVLAVIVILIAAVIVVPFFVPMDTIKQQITEAASDATGRKLTIGGDFNLTVLPRLEMVAGDVTFSNASGARDPEMIRLRELKVRLEILPLLAGKMKVDSFVLVEPVIHLEVNRKGKANWVFGTAGSKPEKSVEAADSDRAGLKEISLGDVRLVDGVVTYLDQRSGQAMEISAINMKVSLPNLDSPFRADGSLVWNGKKVSLVAASEQPRNLMDGNKAPISVKLDSEDVKLTFDGSVATAGALAVDGGLDLDVPSVRKLAAWTGNPLKIEGSGLGPFRLKGQVGVNGPRYAFAATEIALDDIKGEGKIAVDTGSKKVAVDGNLRLGMLDLNPYMPPKKEGEPKTAAKGGPSDWSDDPIDMSGLHAANAKLALSVEGILVEKVKVGRSAVQLSLQNGLLQVDLKDLNLYDGKGSGRIVVDARGKVPSFAESLKLEGVNAAPFLADSAEFDRLEGTASAGFSVSTKGSTERQLVKNLNGNGSVIFKDGAIRGINLAAMVRNVSTAFVSKAASEPEKTDFAELSGTFKITNGILRNDDLKLLSPLLRVTGKGTANLPKRTVDYRIEPKAAATLQGQGGQQQAAGLMVPVLITGPWDNLSYKPDLAGAIGGVAKNPGKALESIKGLKKVLPGGSTATDGSGLKLPDAGKKLKDLFGN